MALSINDAKIIIGMAGRGDKLQDVAAWFGENPARVDEALKGEYGTLEAAPQDQLPPRGAPGPKGRRLRGAVKAALEALDGGDAAKAKATLEEGLRRYNLNET